MLIALWCLVSAVLGFALGYMFKSRPVVEIKCSHEEENYG
jgi:hypothetical protein